MLTHITAIHHWHTMHYWHTRNPLTWHVHVIPCMQAFAWHRCTCVQTCMNWQISQLLTEGTWNRHVRARSDEHINTRICTVLHFHKHTLPLEHWMPDSQTLCQIDTVPRNAGELRSDASFCLIGVVKAINCSESNVLVLAAVHALHKDFWNTLEGFISLFIFKWQPLCHC